VSNLNSNFDQHLIVAICGSLRKPSYTRMALDIALEGAKEINSKTQLINLRDFNLVFCDGKENEENYPQDVFKLRLLVKEAKGIILGTPEYHGNMSGVLKNALDLMGFDELEGKIIGLVGVSAGILGGIEALNTLRNIGRALHAWVIPEQVAIPHAHRVFNTNGKLNDNNLRDRLMELGRQVAKFAFLHNSSKAWDFLKDWQNGTPNPGG